MSSTIRILTKTWEQLKDDCSNKILNCITAEKMRTEGGLQHIATLERIAEEHKETIEVPTLIEGLVDEYLEKLEESQKSDGSENAEDDAWGDAENLELTEDTVEKRIQSNKDKLIKAYKAALKLKAKPKELLSDKKDDKIKPEQKETKAEAKTSALFDDKRDIFKEQINRTIDELKKQFELTKAKVLKERLLIELMKAINNSHQDKVNFLINIHWELFDLYLKNNIYPRSFFTGLSSLLKDINNYTVKFCVGKIINRLCNNFKIILGKKQIKEAEQVIDNLLELYKEARAARNIRLMR